MVRSNTKAVKEYLNVKSKISKKKTEKKKQKSQVVDLHKNGGKKSTNVAGSVSLARKFTDISSKNETRKCIKPKMHIEANVSAAHAGVRKPAKKSKNKRAAFKTSLNKQEFTRTRLGSVSSDSEPEPINADWHVGDHLDEESHWSTQSIEGSFSEVTKNRPDSVSNSSDLEESETDEDEVFSDSVHEDSDSPKAQPSAGDKVKNSTDPIDHCVSKTHGSNLSWNNSTKLLQEIERRSVDLASRSLHLTPVPVTCDLGMLKRLSLRVVSCRLAYNPKTKVLRRYAFLEYADSETANSERKAIAGRLFAGRAVSTQPCRPQFYTSMGSDCIDRCQLFVTGVGSSVTREDLQRAFPKAEVDYPHHAHNQPLGYAIAKFVSPDMALEAFVSAHKRIIRGCPIFVNYVVKPQKVAQTAILVPPSPAKKTKATSGNDQPVKDDHTEKAQPTDKVNLIPVQYDKAEQEGTAKRSKVSIQAIQDVESSDDNSTNTDEEEGPLFTRACPSKGTGKGETSLLAKLISKRRSSAIDSKANTSSEGSSLEGEDDDEDSDEDESTSEDDDDQGQSGSGSSSGDDDDDDDDDDDSGSSADSADSADMPTATKSKRVGQSSKSRQQDHGGDSGSDGEAIDRTLISVMKAHRGARKAVKAAGTNMKWMKAKKTVGPGKRIQPYQLPVPSKKTKK